MKKCVATASCSPHTLIDPYVLACRTSGRIVPRSSFVDIGEYCHSVTRLMTLETCFVLSDCDGSRWCTGLGWMRGRYCSNNAAVSGLMMTSQPVRFPSYPEVVALSHCLRRVICSESAGFSLLSISLTLLSGLVTIARSYFCFSRPNSISTTDQADADALVHSVPHPSENHIHMRIQMYGAYDAWDHHVALAHL